MTSYLIRPDPALGLQPTKLTRLHRDYFRVLSEYYSITLIITASLAWTPRQNLLALPNMVNPASDYEMIRNTLARYALLVDDQCWEDMHQVFTEDCRIHFTFLGPAGELPDIAHLVRFIKTAAKDTVSQHAMSTQSIEFTGPNSAKATTYMTVIHVGGQEHKQKGETFCSWGKLVDKLTKGVFDGKEGWRVTERLIHEQLPSTGNLKLMDH